MPLPLRMPISKPPQAKRTTYAAFAPPLVLTSQANETLFSPLQLVRPARHACRPWFVQDSAASSLQKRVLSKAFKDRTCFVSSQIHAAWNFSTEIPASLAVFARFNDASKRFVG